MSLPASVRKPQELPLGLDQQPLFDLGMRAVRAYARERWTDHNVHDPGVTTLEQLCYALTDLCYRASYPIEDLLAAPTDNLRNMENQFPGPRRALPNRPLTALDYRRLLIDVPGVRNAWIDAVEPVCYADPVAGELHHPAPALPGIREVRLRGLYNALIEFSDENESAAVQAEIIAAARAALQRNRNLCEDWVGIGAVERQPFVLCAEIELTPNADAVQAHARVLLAVQGYLRPGVRRYTRAEMLQRHKGEGALYGDPELFEGPALENGFIDETELEEAGLLEKIRLSDVISLVMDIDGIKAIRDIVIRPVPPDDATSAPPAESKWEVSVDKLKRATLAAEASRLVFYKGRTPVPTTGALDEYRKLKREAEKAFLPRDPQDAPMPQGRFRNPAAYQSVQKHFPAIYGIGELGLPSGASIERSAWARQLEGYLLFFDQLMADYCAQLEHARKLFSLDPDLGRTYACQAVDSIRDFREVYPAAATAAQAELEDPKTHPDTAHRAWRERIGALLQGLAEDRAVMLARRNRFLDHLIARYGERFQDYVELAASLFGVTPAAAARAKCAFLRTYPEMNAERGCACDYTIGASGGALASNVSGLEKRLAHVLGLGTIVYEIYVEHETDGVNPYRFRIHSRISDGILLSSTKGFPTPGAAMAEMGQALERAELISGYGFELGENGTRYFHIVAENGDKIARRIQPFATTVERDAAIAELMALLAAHHGAHLCLIENILLRPRPGSSDALLPICAEPGCGEACAGDDPYSYRVHIVLPANAALFREMPFRRFAEEVIREETPAHLLPKICWVSDEDMVRIEAAWLAWRALLAGTDTTLRADKFAALRDALYSAKNVYPPSVLADCEDPDKFILGRSALGSAPPE